MGNRHYVQFVEPICYYPIHRVCTIIYFEKNFVLLLEMEHSNRCGKNRGRRIVMTKDLLEKAKRLNDDINEIENAIRYFKKGKWSTWGINDDNSSFHFAFLKNYGSSPYDRIDLPTWMNRKIIEVLESEIEKAKNEFDNLK